MKVLRAADYKIMPWKNGMGSTTEIAISPADATLENFVWRISMAQVASDGPFSSFAAIDRTLLVLEGNGLDLSVANQPVTRITRETIHSFPGDQPTSARLVDGSIVDLNVMSRRKIVMHDVRRIKLNGRQDFIVSTQTILIVEQGGLDIVAPTPAKRLGERDAIVVDTSTPTLVLNAGEATQVIAIQFR
ncbi:HutD family protein [Tardiphaga alba]|uniref:HutD family protein n=1 Tax=Tardiphaga alba TaxID=340268 RepID=A0ABX8A3C0_9BRAD|nr:HutD family protein [Tardiphaga alba]QUS38099.1 HutD family protein [Tardiphaga alba]